MTTHSRSGLNAATLILTGFAFACSANEPTQSSSTKPEVPAIAGAAEPGVTSAPTQETFSRFLRKSLQSTHDKTADNAFSASVLSHKITPAQYDLMLKQNLVVFQHFADVLSKDATLPQEMRAHLLRDLGKIIGGFKSDLGMSAEARVSKQDILSGTTVLTEVISSMQPMEVAVCAYQDIGGNAFGTHDLAEVATKLGISNTQGYTLYQPTEFRTLAATMNAHITDSATYPALADAARRFYETHEVLSNSEAFVGK